MIARAAGMIVDFALPPRCPGCGAIVAAMHRFCLGCWQQIRWLGDPSCFRCAMPFPYDQGSGSECAACAADPPAFDRLRAAVAYGEVARKVTLKLKYGGRPGVARTMARYMDRHLSALGENALLAPVPLHRWRIWRRGYNQSALIASALAQASGAEALLDLLKRTRRTPLLRGLGKGERARAVAGAFQVAQSARERIAGRRIILVDDVFTSGATANACAKALKRAGAGEVNILVWARVVIDDVDKGGAHSQFPRTGVDDGAS
jgi:ComF family protein